MILTNGDMIFEIDETTGAVTRVNGQENTAGWTFITLGGGNVVIKSSGTIQLNGEQVLLG